LVNSVHLNRPGKKQISGFGLPTIAVTNNKAATPGKSIPQALDYNALAHSAKKASCTTMLGFVGSTVSTHLAFRV